MNNRYARFKNILLLCFILFNISITPTHAKKIVPICQKDWQQKICDGSMMCYAKKCFYENADIQTLHYDFIQNLIEYLENMRYKEAIDVKAHFKNILEYGIPKDSKKHMFEFKDTNKTCYYSLWKKDEKTLEFNMTGCMNPKNHEEIRTLTKIDEGVIETYYHIGY